jgi:hypothetical protein
VKKQEDEVIRIRKEINKKLVKELHKRFVNLKAEHESD